MPVKLHFLNVGDGDCTIIDFPTRTQGENNLDSRIMVVDFKHNVDHDEYENLINYYKNNFTENGLIKPIFRFIATHPHKDHLTGIKELFENSGVEILNFWDLDHKFKPIQYGENWESYKNDWEKYCNLRNESFVRRYWDDQNEKISFWDEDRITILSPSKELFEYAHKNENGSDRSPEEILIHSMPYVLLININDIKILLASDSDDKCWEYILKNHGNKIGNIDILKAPHHGKKSGFIERILETMCPKNIIFSISQDSYQAEGAEKDYARKCPDANIHSTSEKGNIIFECTYNQPQQINLLSNGTKNIFQI